MKRLLVALAAAGLIYFAGSTLFRWKEVQRGSPRGLESVPASAAVAVVSGCFLFDDSEYGLVEVQLIALGPARGAPAGHSDLPMKDGSGDLFQFLGVSETPLASSVVNTKETLEFRLTSPPLQKTIRCIVRCILRLNTGWTAHYGRSGIDHVLVTTPEVILEPGTTSQVDLHLPPIPFVRARIAPSAGDAITSLEWTLFGWREDDTREAAIEMYSGEAVPGGSLLIPLVPNDEDAFVVLELAYGISAVRSQPHQLSVGVNELEFAELPSYGSMSIKLVGRDDWHSEETKDAYVALIPSPATPFSTADMFDRDLIRLAGLGNAAEFPAVAPGTHWAIVLDGRELARHANTHLGVIASHVQPVEVIEGAHREYVFAMPLEHRVLTGGFDYEEAFRFLSGALVIGLDESGGVLGASPVVDEGFSFLVEVDRPIEFACWLDPTGDRQEFVWLTAKWRPESEASHPILKVLPTAAQIPTSDAVLGDIQFVRVFPKFVRNSFLRPDSPRLAFDVCDEFLAFEIRPKWGPVVMRGLPRGLYLVALEDQAGEIRWSKEIVVK